MATPGCRAIHGDGRHSIMAGGYTTAIEDGHGYLVTNGVQHGSTGALVMVITDGHLWLPVSVCTYR